MSNHNKEKGAVMMVSPQQVDSGELVEFVRELKGMVRAIGLITMFSVLIILIGGGLWALIGWVFRMVMYAGL